MTSAIVRRIIGLTAGTAIAFGVVGGGAMGPTGTGNATPFPVPMPLDPHIPVAAVDWCPGGGSLNQWGGSCEGKTYPDGTRWNVAWADTGEETVEHPMKCVIHNGSPFPPAAGAGGCGRAIGGHRG